MGNPGNKYLWIPILPIFTPLYLYFLLHHLINTASGESPSPYTPIDNIIINCGSSSNSTALDGRTWIGDVNSKFFPLEQSQNEASVTKSTLQHPSYVVQVPYSTARLSVSEFTYIFPVTAGQKFIRLYFYPALYPKFDRSKALFSVKAGPFTLLGDFNASLTADADADSEGTIYREFCVNIEEDQRLNITFIPIKNAYAFINGIEVVSMPTNLYYTPAEDPIGFRFLAQQQRFRIENTTALETVYRVNVGGPSLTSTEDTGMFRSWIDQEKNYLTEFRQNVIPVNTSIQLSFTKETPPYTAPEAIYRTARTMGSDKAITKTYNLTWEFPVDSGFNFLVRLHFCEFQPEITKRYERVFLIFIANQTAEQAADVMQWTDGKKGVPVRRDYAVSMVDKESAKKINLSVALQANSDLKTAYNDAILNGIEIFKVSNFSNSLAGPNPDPLPTTPLAVVPPTRQSTKKKNNTTTIISVAGGVLSGLVVLSILGFLIIRRGKRVKVSDPSDKTSWWGPFSFTTTKSTKTRNSTLPSDLCRRFSLAEIRAATDNFDGLFIIGVGGFGDVYKGYIDGGATPVAIKRLKSGSEQGAHEFETEIGMLSQLRHLHLVSLIGYCNDGNEMILVYDFMARGTLRDHLYKTSNPPLSWKQRLEICIGAAQGLSYLHKGAKHTIIHRDVKTTNILLDENWTAKVSDFGLSKMGPTSMSNAHVSTAVKGSIGYLDPEYYRRQKLTEKSDVYSFGVVLCEVLCARPPVVRAAEKKQVSLAEWTRNCYSNGKLDKIIDPFLKGKIAPECLIKFGEIAVSCLLDNGIERPSMNDVVWSLEFALQLQESADKNNRLGTVEIEPKCDEQTLLPKLTSDDNDNDDVFSNSGGHMSTTKSNSRVTTTSSEEQSFTSKDSDLQVSGAVFSELMNSKGR